MIVSPVAVALVCVRSSYNLGFHALLFGSVYEGFGMPVMEVRTLSYTLTHTRAHTHTTHTRPPTHTYAHARTHTANTLLLLPFAGVGVLCFGAFHE